MDPNRWEQINRLYYAALELDTKERARFLEESCHGDSGLRAEVETLLATHEKAGEFLDSPAIEAVARQVAEEPPSLVGRQLGPYQILGLLGSGGMGEVYRARDTRLDRQVAIKVLPEAFTGDSERLARFEREAKLLASLNHPYIAAIYGLEEADGKRFLVLELVEGETLAEWLSRGPLPIEMALGVCRQIAEGVEAAHEKGIIHRDLKPGNVKITPEGKVKILDFGLAKAYQKEGSVPDLSKSPTLTDEMTGAGVILGTAAYMSPEQATGKPVDRRTDVWGFGCVLFECLTGRQAFQGETVAEILATILKSEPDWQVLPAATPSKAKDLLHRCLQKDPRERLHDIADARIEIGESLGQPSEVVSLPRRFSSRWRLELVAVGLIAGVLISAGLMWYFRPTPASPVVSSVVKVEPRHGLDGLLSGRTALSLSGDGRFVVYSAIAESPEPHVSPQLYLRRIDHLEARPIPGTEGGSGPFLSPDDRWVGFWAGGKLMKVAIDGGVPVTLWDAASPLGPPFGTSWGPDNSIVFSPDLAFGLYRIPADGGKPEILTTPDKTKDEASHRLPHWLPEGKRLLFTIMREFSDSHPRVAWLDLKTRKWRVLVEDAADARYVLTGHLVFLRQGILMAVPFDLVKLEVTGQPVPVVPSVMQALDTTGDELNTAAGQFSISESGWLIYAMGGIVPDLENSLLWVDQKGNAQPATSFKAPFFTPRLSPDGKQITYTTHGRENNVWVYDISRSTVNRLTGEGRPDYATWTPDGGRVVFKSWSAGRPNLYWQTADGSQPMERLTSSDYYPSPGSFSRDGASLAFVEWHPDTRYDILLLDLQSRRVTPFLNSRADERWPEFSPNGHWMAYVSDESGRGEVYVRPFPGPGGKWLISNGGGREPLWARNGKQLFYRSEDGQQVWVVDVQTDGGFSVSKPRLLLKAPKFDRDDPVRSWDISLDGQRFLMVKLEERSPQPVTEMILVQNWFEELKRLVPAGKR